MNPDFRVTLSPELTADLPAPGPEEQAEADAEAEEESEAQCLRVYELETARIDAVANLLRVLAESGVPERGTATLKQLCYRQARFVLNRPAAGAPKAKEKTAS